MCPECHSPYFTNIDKGIYKCSVCELIFSMKLGVDCITTGKSGGA